jgi:peptidoglycan/LPS O-acetylase OafA/YrhL
MAIASPWTYFALLALVLAVTALPWLRFVDTAPRARARFVALDGLRGLAAISVFAFHVVVTHGFITTGRWEPPTSGFYSLLGPASVSLFFMITGFLFWTKLLSAAGGGSWRALYVGRLFRIAPMYLVAVLAMLAIVFAKTGFELHEPLRDVVGASAQWLALGIVNLQPDVNGYPATHVLAGVTWTISYEWAFYASLLASVAVARSRAHLPLVAAALVLCLAGKTLLNSSVLGFAALFLSGMTVASLLHAKKAPALSDRLGSAFALGCLAAIVVASSFNAALSGYGTVATLLLAVFFYCICSGATVFGLLTTRAAQRLGSISYSVYLLQGIVLTLVFTVGPLRDFAMRAAANYWLVGVLCACVLIAAAGITFVFVERPCIALGKRFARRSDLPGAVRHESRPVPFAAVPEPRRPAPTTVMDRRLHRRY